MEGARGHRIGVDVGGTFTDLTLADAEGVIGVGKVLTTPAEPARGIVEVVERTLRDCGVAVDKVAAVVHGNTLVTNTIIERKGSRVALLTTEGFRDSLELGDERRYDLYDLMLERPEPLVPRHLRFEVPERTLADGDVERPLDTELVADLGAELAERGVEAVAVAFLHSYKNPQNERAARDALRGAAPGLRVGLSCEIAPELGEHPRTSTAVASVYVQAQVETYLDDLELRLARVGFSGSLYVMLSHGGIATVSTAKRLPIGMLESSCAGGTLAATQFASRSGQRDLLAFDMGGTTAKACVVNDGRPHVAREFEVARSYRLKPGSGLRLRAPVVEMIEIGVGGGSIATIDSLGLLGCGPESAGSDPGPACYGLGGTRPTLTDANLVLGYLGADTLLGGELRVDPDLAREAIQEGVAEPLGVSVEQAAWGIHRIATEDMANAARIHVAERGCDPSALPVCAFGGAGPIHAAGIARRIGAPSVVVPPAAGVLASNGFLAAPLSFDSARSARAPVAELSPAMVYRLYAALEESSSASLVAAGVAREEIVHARTADLHFAGQGSDTRVEAPGGEAGWPQEVLGEFAREYRRLYGREGPAVDVEVASVRVVSRGPEPRMRPAERSGGRSEGLRRTRRAYFGGFVETPVYDDAALAAGIVLDGPAIVEQREATVVVPPGARCLAEADASLIIRFDGEGPVEA